MGIISFLKKLSHVTTDVLNGDVELSTLKPVIPNIPQEVNELLWFADGPRQNYKPSSVTEYIRIGGFTIEVPFKFMTDEPSAIYVNSPFKRVKENVYVPRPNYYPTFMELSPEQRWRYYEFLQNPYSGKHDIGYVFLFYYGLERHLFLGDFEKAFDIVLKLRDIYSNTSFQKYSANALILSAAIHKQGSFLEKFINSIDKDYEYKIDPNLYFLSKFSLDIGITPYEIMRFHKGFSFTNERYIKQYPDLFLQFLSENFKKEFGSDLLLREEFFSPDITKDMVYEDVSLFANMSIMDKTLRLPNILMTYFGGAMYVALKAAHEDVKKYLAEKRKAESKNGTSPKSPSSERKGTVSKKPKENSSKLSLTELKSNLHYDINSSLNSPNNQKALLSDINILNKFLGEASQLSARVPPLKIKKSEIVFSGSDASFMTFSPFTNSGAYAKFPLTVEYRTEYYTAFNPPHNYFGSISILKDGNIGKANMVCWQGDEMYNIKLAVKNNALKITRIEHGTSDGTIEKLYVLQ